MQNSLLLASVDLCENTDMKTVDVTLLEDERDFIVELIHYALSDELLEKLQAAIPDSEGQLSVPMTLGDFEELISNLSLEANNHEVDEIKEKAFALTEILEPFEFRLKDMDVH